MLEVLSKSRRVYPSLPCAVEIDTELSFEAINFKRKEKLGKKNPSCSLKTQGAVCRHTHTFAVNHTPSPVLSLKQRFSLFLL